MSEAKVRGDGERYELGGVIGLEEPGSLLFEGASGAFWQSRLKANPLLVLLPQCGDLRILATQRATIEGWLEREEGGDSVSAEAVTMLKQVLFWIPAGEESEEEVLDGVQIISAMYELGRLYFESGFTSAAERIFHGLCAFEPTFTPGWLGTGILRLERGQFNEALSALRDAIQHGRYVLEAKLALCGAFIALGEFRRAASILQELAKASSAPDVDPDITRLWQAFTERCIIAER